MQPGIDSEPAAGPESWSTLARVALAIAGTVRRQDAEDLAQEAMLLFLDRIDRVASPIAWLRVVIRRLAIRRAVRRRRRQRAESEYARETRGCDMPDVDLAVLAGRAEKHRAVLTLRADGASYKGIGKSLGCSTRAAGVRVLRARRAARRLLGLESAL